ncbi:putative HNH endonuclease [Lactobacillus phage Ld3]|uniref:Putative HNH endonuclease n=1 Tax=Lactobacillus phage Ld3 TaxID=1500735 RepID=A0A075KKC6_9CAUD|nr:HNH endonuclease [Lactobacillus phage Ld3]AIF54455.1 putative HNH endonuclease [Lactobacillus phage Ld3]
MTDEIWKDIFGYGGVYQVSNMGRVRSCKRKSWKILRAVNLKNGYEAVNLYSDKRQMFYVHRLVAQAFIPNPNEYRYVNHKNEVKTDNRVSNLEWCTAFYNNHYSDIYKSTRTRVTQYSKDMVKIRSFISQREASRATGIPQPDISICCNYKQQTAGGYIWRFE